MLIRKTLNHQICIYVGHWMCAGLQVHHMSRRILWTTSEALCVILMWQHYEFLVLDAMFSMEIAGLGKTLSCCGGIGGRNCV